MNRIKQINKKSLTAIDWFVIIGAVLLLVAIVVQDVTLYGIESKKKAENFSLSVTVLSVENEDADRLVVLRQNKGELEAFCGEELFGKFDGGFVKTPVEYRDGTNSEHLFDLSATLTAKGRTVDGKTEIYKCGNAAQGDEILLSIGDGVYTVRINAITTVG